MKLAAELAGLARTDERRDRLQAAWEHPACFRLQSGIAFAVIPAHDIIIAARANSSYMEAEFIRWVRNCTKEGCEMIDNIRDCTVLNNGLKMPWLGFGVFQVPDGEVVEKAVGQALALGYRSVDTAAVYHNERGVGKALRENGVPREEVFLTTKVWNDDQRARRTRAAFVESLKLLGTDYVDLYLIHWPVKGYYKETWKALEEIYRSGRAKAIGVSNFLVHHLEDLLSNAEVVPAVNQVEFHPRLLQPDLLKYCRDHHIQLEAWAPLMQGRIMTEPRVLELSEKYHKTPAQIVLRWDLQHEVVTIPKSVHASRIAENAQIFDFELSQEDMDALDALDTGQRLGADPDNFNF